MDIRLSGVHSAYTHLAAKKAPAAHPHPPRACQQADSVSLSAAAGDYQLARQAALAATPPIRTDLVEKIRSQIANGTYNVSGLQIAARIFGMDADA